MPKKRKILIQICWYYPIGGIESFAINITSALKNEYEIALLSSYYGYKKAAPIQHGVKEYVANNSPKETKKAILDFKPDIIIFNNAMPINYYALWLTKKQKIPTIYVVRQIPVFNDFGKLSPFLNFIQWQLKKWYMNNATKIITPSQSVKNIIKKMIKKEIAVMPNGINTERFQTVSNDKKIKLRKQYGLPVDKNIILWVGRFSKEKNLAMFIKAVEEDQDKNNFYLVAGFYPASKFNRSTKTNELLRRADQSSKVKTIINTPYESIHTLYQLADIYVSTSTFETLSNTTLEAAATGLTTVVPNHSGIKEAGRNGYLYNYNKKDLLMTIKKATSSPLNTNKSIRTSANVGEEYSKIIKELL